MLKLKGKKIFYSFGTDQPVQCLWQYYHFIDELKKNDIEFELFNRNEFKSENYEEILIRKIRLMKKDIAFFLTGDADWQLSGHTISEIRKMGIPTLLICYDNLTVPYNHFKNARFFDLVWLTSSETEYLFRKWGARTVFLPYAANPNKFYPIYKDEIPSVGFIGSISGARGYKIKLISDNEIPLRVYTNKSIIDNILPTDNKKAVDLLSKIKDTFHHGYYLSKFKEGRKLLKADMVKAVRKRFDKNLVFNNNVDFFESVSFEEMNQLYSNFALSLGIIEVWNTYLLKNPMHKLHLRTFEIPMCGGLQITNRCKEIEQYFEDGKEILLYSSKEEMIDKMNFYLKNENEDLRKKIKQAARVRSEKEHTWFNRFSTIYPLLFP